MASSSPDTQSVDTLEGAGEPARLGIQRVSINITPRSARSSRDQTPSSSPRTTGARPQPASSSPLERPISSHSVSRVLGNLRDGIESAMSTNLSAKPLTQADLFFSSATEHKFVRTSPAGGAVNPVPFARTRRRATTPNRQSTKHAAQSFSSSIEAASSRFSNLRSNPRVINSDTHLVRLSPIGHTFVSYVSRHRPFVSYVSEVSLSRDDEDALRAEADKVPLLEAQIEALKESIMDFHREISAKALKFETRRAKAAIMKWRGVEAGSDEGSGGGGGGGEGGDVDEDDNDHMFDGGIGSHIQEMLKENISLRLRAVAASVPMAHRHVDNSTQHWRQWRRRRQDLQSSSLSSMDERDANLKHLRGELAQLEVSTELQAREGGVDGGGALESEKAIMEAVTQGNVASALALKKAMERIGELDSKLMLAEAKLAIHQSTVPAGDSSNASGGSGDVFDDLELRELRQRMLDLRAEVAAKDQRIEDLSATGSDLLEIMNSSNGSRKGLQRYFTSPPLNRKIVIMPFFTRSTEELGAPKNKKKTTAQQKHGKATHAYNDDGGEDINEDDDDDDDDDGSDDSDESDDAKDDGIEGGDKSNGRKAKRKKRQQMKVKLRQKMNLANDGSGSRRHSASWQNLKKRYGTRSLFKPRRVNHSLPIQSSPLAKYSTWHPNDKKTVRSIDKLLSLNYKILEKKAVQESFKEQKGAPIHELSSLAEFVEIYYLREFGHLAKYHLRVYVHSIKHYMKKDGGDPRVELFAFLLGLHHPELYSRQVSCAFMRLLRGLFPDHKSIAISLGKYDRRSQASRFLIPKKRVLEGLVGSTTTRSSKSWQCHELVHLCSASDIKTGLIKPIQEMESAASDTVHDVIDIDPVLFLVMDFFVVEVIRQQLRLRAYFERLMEESIAKAASEKPPEYHDRAGINTVSLVSWEQFAGFASLAETVTGRGGPTEADLMAVFTAFEDFVDRLRPSDDGDGDGDGDGDEKGGYGDDGDDSSSGSGSGSDGDDAPFESDARPAAAAAAAAAAEEGRPKRGWHMLRSQGALHQSLSAAKAKKAEEKRFIEERAVALAALCYQAGLYLPRSAADVLLTGQDDLLKVSSIMNWASKKEAPTTTGSAGVV